MLNFFMNKGYTFIEIKTTGFNPVLDRICFISLTEFDITMRAKRSYSSWINPEGPLSKGMSKFLGVTTKELQQSPTFSEVADIVNSFIKTNTLGTFDDSVDVLEFLKESFFDEDINLKYAKRDFIVVKTLEEHLYRRDLDTLYYKYTGSKIKPDAFHTKAVGEIFKFQCMTLGDDTRTFNYYKNVKDPVIELTDKFLYTLNSKLYLNFGRFKGKEVSEVKKSYIEWMMESEFPNSVKDKIKEYLNYG